MVTARWSISGWLGPAIMRGASAIRRASPACVGRGYPDEINIRFLYLSPVFTIKWETVDRKSPE